MRAVRVASSGLVFGAMLLALGHAHPEPVAHSLGSNVLFNGDFEAGTDGWVATGDGPIFEVDAGEPRLAGSGAGRLRSTASVGTVTLRSQYWHTPVEPGATYVAALHLHASGPAVTVSSVRLQLVDDLGGSLPVQTELEPVTDTTAAPFERYETVDTAAPPNAAYARLVVTAAFESDTATLSIDGASILLVAAPPPPPPPDPVTSPPPTPTPSGTPTPPPGATATATPAPTLSPTPSITAVLRNANFEEGVDGWDVTRGQATAEAIHPDFGLSLVMRSTGTTTMWVQQAVTVVPGAWYNAAASLAPGSGVTAGWVRIAWYVTPDASGAQLSTDDSPAIPSTGAGLHAFEMLETGPVQAPPGALSARVRILLRPATAGASMAVDNVLFHPTSAPPPPTPTPTATATPAPTATATATPESASEPSPLPDGDAEPEPPARSQPAPPPPASAAPARSPEERAALAAAQIWIRITELLPNAPVSGIDASYEWVELTNVGPTSASLEGMRLEDNHAALDVDPIVLAPGASLVIAAPLADVGAAAVVQRVPVIGNGLSNTGDRLALYAIDGTLVDALSYGSDETYMVEDARITAPRSGYSIVRRFGPDGTLVDVLHSAAPTPGVAQLLDPAAIAQADDDPAAQPEPVAATEDAADDPAPIPAAPRAQTAERSMWTTLLLVAAALVGGFASRRTASIIREHRAAAAQARDLSGD